MKKILLGLSLFSTLSLFAQSDDNDEKIFHFGLGGTISLPIGDLKEATSYGVGFEIQPSYSFTQNVEGFLQTGVNVFKGKEYFGTATNSLLHVPILVGARFKTNHFFAGAGVGYGLWTSDGQSSNGFTYSPQVGYDGGKIEVGLNYTSTVVTGGSNSYIGIKIFRKL